MVGYVKDGYEESKLNYNTKQQQSRQYIYNNRNSTDISSPQSMEASTNDIRERAIEVRGFLDFGFFVGYSYNYLSVEWSPLPN